MEKMQYPKGLISYTTLNKLAGGTWTWKRPKLIGYGTALAILVSLFITVLYLRTPLSLDVIRDRGQLYQEVAGGRIENVYTLKIINMSDETRRYVLRTEGLPNPTLLPDTPVEVPAREMFEHVVRIQVDPDQLRDFNTEFEFELSTEADAGSKPLRTEAESRFFGPRPFGAGR